MNNLYTPKKITFTIMRLNRQEKVFYYHLFVYICYIVYIMGVVYYVSSSRFKKDAIALYDR